MNLLLEKNVFGDLANKNNVLTKAEASDLLNDWVKNERLRLHMKQVAYLMQGGLPVLPVLTLVLLPHHILHGA